MDRNEPATGQVIKDEVANVRRSWSLTACDAQDIEAQRLETLTVKLTV